MIRLIAARNFKKTLRIYRHAFILTELLVVVFITTNLAVTLFSALSQAREGDRRAVYMNTFAKSE